MIQRQFSAFSVLRYMEMGALFPCTEQSPLLRLLFAARACMHACTRDALREAQARSCWFGISLVYFRFDFCIPSLNRFAWISSAVFRLSPLPSCSCLRAPCLPSLVLSMRVYTPLSASSSRSLPRSPYLPSPFVPFLTSSCLSAGDEDPQPCPGRRGLLQEYLQPPEPEVGCEA